LRSYAAAARELLLTTPAVWEQMRGLERHYGCKLFRRSGSGIQLTTEGEQLLAMAQPIVAGIDSTREALRQRGGALPQSLTLATNLRVLTEEISRGLRRFQRSYPDVRLHLVFTGNDVDQRISSGDANVGLTLEPGPDRAGGLSIDYRPAGEVDYLLILPPRHPLARARLSNLRQLTRYPLVLGESAAYSRRRVEEVLHRCDLRRSIQIAVETNSDEYTLACVRAGLGIGISIGIGRGPLYGGLTVRSLRRWFGTARLGFVWQRGAHIPPSHHELANAVASCLKA
jgi:DNA-binding transcriptional LysR family regulator